MIAKYLLKIQILYNYKYVFYTSNFFLAYF